MRIISAVITLKTKYYIISYCNRHSTLSRFRDVSSKNVILKDPQRGTLCLKLSPHSMNTVKYKQ